MWKSFVSALHDLFHLVLSVKYYFKQWSICDKCYKERLRMEDHKFSSGLLYIATLFIFIPAYGTI